jgi:hypothetical protein
MVHGVFDVDDRHLGREHATASMMAGRSASLVTPQRPFSRSKIGKRAVALYLQPVKP